VKSRFRCRSCGSSGAELVLDLGETPLANALLKEEDLVRPEPTHPLELVFCPGCSLVQITETVASRLAERLVAERHLGSGSLVVEAASNDGYLLRHYAERGVRVLGIDPAHNVAEVARERGVPTRAEFFGVELAEELAREGQRADLFHAHNVLAHVPDLNGFVRGIAVLLRERGVACIEVPYLRDLIDHVEFDTIYHEHLCYFSLTALTALFRRHELAILDVERIPVHGGSLRLFCQRRGGEAPSQRPAQLLAEESELGMDRIEYYRSFAERVGKLRGELRALLARLREEGKRVAAYGASAKGSTLLNTFGIGRETLDFVVDRSTVKQGRYLPGTHLPILPTEALLEQRPDYVLLLTWNFADEILEQQRSYREAGGRFLVPIPRLEVV
jgi:SAM-dependent methyltransferase